MKFRLHRSSLRIRLGPHDIDTLRRTGRCVDQLHVMPGDPPWQYGLVLSDHWQLDHSTGLQLTTDASFEGWCNGDALSFHHQLGSLTLLIERDLPCRDGRDDSNSNVFHDRVNVP